MDNSAGFSDENKSMGFKRMTSKYTSDYMDFMESSSEFCDDSMGYSDHGQSSPDDNDNRGLDGCSPDYMDTCRGVVCCRPGRFKHHLSTKIPIATWRLAELEFFSTRIPIAKWRLQEFYMEKKTKYRGTATSFGFKKPVTASVIPNPITNNVAPLAHQERTDSVESLVSAPTARSGTPRLSRPKKETNNAVNGRTNRFGFRGPSALSNKVADSQNNINSTKANLRLDGLVPPESAKHPPAPQPRSHLPRPQFPVRLAAPAHYRTASVEKSDKTAANHHTARRSRSENGGSSASSVNDADSGVGSQKSRGELEMIEQLECSPSARNRLRKTQKARPMEMIFPSGNEKKFELRDLRDSVEMTEIVPLQLPPLPLGKRLPQDRELVRERAKAYSRQLSSNNSGSSEDDEGIEDEEKQHRDRVLSEKDEIGVMGAGDGGVERDDLWGHGEAMVGEEDMPGGRDFDSDQGCPAAPLRSVLLSIEDHSFAALAAMSTSSMLEDVCFPELPDFQDSLSLTITSPVISPNNSPPQQTDDKKNLDDSPGSPGTPTHTSNSLSFSSDIRDRDFIDDEICDQPGLVYDNVTANSSGNTLVADDVSPRFMKPRELSAVGLTVDCSSGHHSPVETLSPCESLISDDLIMDFDLSAVDDDHRLDTSSLDVALTDAEGDEQTTDDHSTLLSTRPELLNGVRATRQLRPRVGSTGSGTDSPRSLDTPRLRSGSAISSPLRSCRQGTSSPGEDLSEDSGIRVQHSDFQAMYQDVINIKALLYRLGRTVQETEAEKARAATQQNGFYSDVDKKAEDSQAELVTDLQRQVLFLQSQLEEKDRIIRSLQTTPPLEPCGRVDTCNAATQTERVRPLSTGSILTTQADPAGGSFVSNTSECVRLSPLAPHRTGSRLPQWRDQHKPLPPVRKQT